MQLNSEELKLLDKHTSRSRFLFSFILRSSALSALTSSPPEGFPAESCSEKVYRMIQTSVFSLYNSNLRKLKKHLFSLCHELLLFLCHEPSSFWACIYFIPVLKHVLRLQNKTHNHEFEIYLKTIEQSQEPKLPTFANSISAFLRARSSLKLMKAPQSLSIQINQLAWIQ